MRGARRNQSIDHGHSIGAQPGLCRRAHTIPKEGAMTMAKRDYHIISSDSHTVEPPDLWEKWLERKYLDTAPKLVDDGDGGHAWIYMGATTPEPLGLVTCVGTRPEELKWTGKRYGVNIHPSCYDGAERLKIMDVDG